MSAEGADPLDALRAELEAVDRAFVQTLGRRQRLVEAIGAAKRESDLALRDRGRERDVFARVEAAARAEGLDPHFTARLFRDIIDHAIRTQQARLAGDPAGAVRRIRVSYQGTESSYGHQAALRHFSPYHATTVYRAFETFRDMLLAVRAGDVDYAVLPIENTTAGSINESYDLLARMDLALVGEEVQPIDHCLIGIAPTPLSELRRVYSHPQALAQCSDFLAGMAGCHAEPFGNTALAVEKIVADNDPAQAAIASEAAAERTGLHVLAREISNLRDNFTRFVIVAREPVASDHRVHCKTSVLFVTKHEQGALVSCLNVLADRGLNLTKLESRPRPGAAWESQFYVDFEGNQADPAVQEALGELAARSLFLKVFGSYPARTTAEAQVDQRSEAAMARHLAEPPGVLRGPAPVRPLGRTPDPVVHVGRLAIGGGRVAILAGAPADASWEELESWARAVRDAGADLIRVGSLTPSGSITPLRLGDDALRRLVDVARKVDLPVAVELVNPGDVARTARMADVLEIGGANMQSAALLEAVGRVDRPVLLQRSVTASVDEWIRAAEYLLAQGNQQVILCESGVRTLDPTGRPVLDLGAIAAVRTRARRPILVDPSQAARSGDAVLSLALAAVAAGADGVLVDVDDRQPRPASDRESVTPSALQGALIRLRERPATA